MLTSLEAVVEHIIAARAAGWCDGETAKVLCDLAMDEDTPRATIQEWFDFTQTLSASVGASAYLKVNRRDQALADLAFEYACIHIIVESVLEQHS